MFKLPRQLRITEGPFAIYNTPDNGYWLIPCPCCNNPFLVKACRDKGREIVCGKLDTKIASWDLMNAVKSHFWDESDRVIIDNDPNWLFMFVPAKDDDCYENYISRRPNPVSFVM